MICPSMGVGLKHDLMQYIPIVGNFGSLDLSIQFEYRIKY